MASAVPLPTEDPLVKMYAKAIVGAVVTLLSSLAVAAVDNSITLGEGIAALAAGAAAGAAVYGIRNAP